MDATYYQSVNLAGRGGIIIFDDEDEESRADLARAHACFMVSWLVVVLCSNLLLPCLRRQESFVDFCDEVSWADAVNPDALRE